MVASRRAGGEALRDFVATSLGLAPRALAWPWNRSSVAALGAFHDLHHRTRCRDAPLIELESQDVAKWHALCLAVGEDWRARCLAVAAARVPWPATHALVARWRAADARERLAWLDAQTGALDRGWVSSLLRLG